MKNITKSMDEDNNIKYSKIDIVNDITYSKMEGNIYHSMDNMNSNSSHEL